MRNLTTLVLLSSLVVAGWISPSPLSAGSADVVVNEVFYLGDSTTDWVELRNGGTTTVDLSSWWICSRFSYRQLSTLPLLAGADLILAPGEILAVGTGIDLDANSADFGLYTSSTFSSAAAMVDFVQWGSGSGIGRSQVAATAGLWSQMGPGSFDFVPLAPAGQSLNLRLNGSGGLTLAEEFLNQPPTLGTPNTGAVATETTRVGDLKARW